jgi:LysR family hydrogen peroxide-inducible transcriptional activator
VEIHQVLYFVRLAQLGNFTRAAEACHVSQPTLSHQIAKLEQELARPLFERLGRGARLTDAGRVFKERAEQILALVDDARESVIADAEEGRLVVAAIPTVAPYLLPEVLVRFAADNPKARVDVREYPTAEILERITAGEIDLAVLALPIPDEALHVETLLTEELLLALPAGHRLADKPRVRFKDLANVPFVLLHDAHCLAGETKQFCARHSLAPVTTAQLHQLATVAQLVRLGHGVSFVPQMATSHAPGLVFRSLGGEGPTRTLATVWSKLRYRSPLFIRFVKALAHRTCGRKDVGSR